MAKISSELLTASEKASEKYGIPKEVILGFAGLETSFGTAGVGQSKNNLFGIMNSNGVAKSYSSVTASVEDFAQLVTGNKTSAQSQKYGKAVSTATTPAEWISAITKAGYNSEYAEGVYEGKVMNVIQTQLGNDLITNVSKSESEKSNKELKWWGDVIIVVLAILLVCGGVILLGLGVTNTSTGGKVMSSVKKIAKEVM